MEGNMQIEDTIRRAEWRYIQSEYTMDNLQRARFAEAINKLKLPHIREQYRQAEIICNGAGMVEYVRRRVQK